MKYIKATFLTLLFLLASVSAFALDGASVPAEVKAYIDERLNAYDEAADFAEVEDTDYCFVLLHQPQARKSCLVAFKKDASGVYQFLWANDQLFPVRSAGYIDPMYDDDQAPSLWIGIPCEDGDDGYEEFNAVLTAGGWMINGKPLQSLRASDILYNNPGPVVYASDDGLSLTLQNVALKPGRVYDVAYGPSAQYEYASQADGTLSTNEWVQVFGRDGDWLLIQYPVKEGQYRVGYIPHTALRQGETVQSVSFAFDKLVRTVRDTFLTDDPLGRRVPIREIKADMEVRHLASIKGWLYVEVPAYGAQKAIRGFVPDTAFIQMVTNMWYDEAFQMPGYAARVTYGVYFYDAVYENRLDTARTWQVVLTVDVTGQRAGDQPIEKYRLYNGAGELVNESPVSSIDPTPRLNGTFFLSLALNGARPKLTLVPCYQNAGERPDEEIAIQIE